MHVFAKKNSRLTDKKHSRDGSTLAWTIGVLTLISMMTATWMVSFRDDSSGRTDILVHTVARGNFTHEVVEQGEVESAVNVEVRCEVKARNSTGTRILEVVEEGTNVKEGDLLCRLDGSGFEQELVQQQILCNSSEALMIEANNTFDAAEIGKKEYVEGTFHQEEQMIQSELFIAEENLRRAKEYVNYSQRLAARGYVTTQQLEGDRFAVEIAQTDLDTAKTKLRVLREYTKPKMLIELESAIKSAEAKKKSEESSYNLELSKLKEIEEQIANCEIRAPAAGQVVHANKQSSRSGAEFVVEAGAEVRENQVIFRLPDPDTMRVNARINESRVTLVKAGMPATIRLDAYGDQILEGRVTRVNEYPEPSSWFSSQVKEYATFIEIIDSPIQIRPGLTAEVTIFVDEREDVIRVPVQTIHQHGPKLYCMVRKDQGWEAREIEMISTNDKFAVIESGVAEGERLAMTPRQLLDQVDLPELDPEEEAARLGRRRKGDGRPGGGPRAGERGAGGPAGRGTDATQIVGAIFSRLDQNGDGRITAEEIPPDEVGRLTEADTNGDGVVERAEMRSAISRMSAGGPPEGR
jgi:multidrug resistance efflux pump